MRASLTVIMTVFVAACSDGPVDPHRIDGTYSGATDNYEGMVLAIDRTDDAIAGHLVLRDAAGALVYDGPVAGTFWSPTQFHMQGTAIIGGEVRLIELEGTVVHEGLAVTITSTWLPQDTFVLRPV